MLALELGTGAGFGAGGGCNKYRCFFWSLGMEHVQAWTALASEQVLTLVGTGTGFGTGSGPVVAMEQAQALFLELGTGVCFLAGGVRPGGGCTGYGTGTGAGFGAWCRCWL